MGPPILLEVGALLRHVVPVAAVAAQLCWFIILAPPPYRRRRRPPIQLRRHPPRLFIVVRHTRGLRQLHSRRRLQGGLRPAPQSRRRAVAVASVSPQSIIKSRQGGLLRLRSLRFTRPGPPLAPRLGTRRRLPLIWVSWRCRLRRVPGGAGPPYSPPFDGLLRREGLLRRRRGAAAPIRARALVAVAGGGPQAQHICQALGGAPHPSVRLAHRRRPVVARRAAPTVRAPRSGLARNADLQHRMTACLLDSRVGGAAGAGLGNAIGVAHDSRLIQNNSP